MPEMKPSGFLEPYQVKKLIQHVEYVSSSPKRDTLLLELLWQTGARVTEGIELLPEHVGVTSIRLKNEKQVKKIKLKTPEVKKDKAGNVIYSKEGVPVMVSMRLEHNPRAIKEVEVSSKLCTAIKEFCKEERIEEGDWVFKAIRKNGHMTRWYVWKLMDRASRSADIIVLGKRDFRTDGKYKGAYPHILRHSNAMFLLETTREISLVQAQLGHSTTISTQAYAYTKKPRIRKAVAEMNWY